MSYIGNSPEFWNLSVNKYNYTATAGQTIFPAVYDSIVDVFLNGSKLQSGTDYTANTGVSVTLSLAATDGDIIDIAGYFNMEVFATNKGLTVPVVTTTQKNTIVNPTQGLLVFDSTIVKLCVYTGSAWQTVTSV